MTEFHPAPVTEFHCGRYNNGRDRQLLISIVKWLRQKQLALLAALGVMIVILVPALYLYLLVETSLSVEELDFDGNGIVTFSELIHANLHCGRDKRKSQVSCK
jgi:hypothetical protein